MTSSVVEATLKSNPSTKQLQDLLDQGRGSTDPQTQFALSRIHRFQYPENDVEVVDSVDALLSSSFHDFGEQLEPPPINVDDSTLKAARREVRKLIREAKVTKSTVQPIKQQNTNPFFNIAEARRLEQEASSGGDPDAIVQVLVSQPTITDKVANDALEAGNAKDAAAMYGRAAAMGQRDGLTTWRRFV